MYHLRDKKSTPIELKGEGYEVNEAVKRLCVRMMMWADQAQQGGHDAISTCSPVNYLASRGGHGNGGSQKGLARPQCGPLQRWWISGRPRPRNRRLDATNTELCFRTWLSARSR